MVRVTSIEIIDKLYLVGAPGIGKTEIIKQKAMEEAERKRKKFIDLREASEEELDSVLRNPRDYYVYYRIIATHVFPEDLGIPRERGSYIEFLPPKVLKVLSIPDVEGVLFIDELSNVQRDDQISMLYSIIQEKEASWILKLSPRIKIVCAGNPGDWSEIVRTLPKPLRSRLTIARVDPPTVDEWVKYMEERYGDRWEKLTAAYLKVYPEDLIKVPESDEDNYPTPRNWTELAVLLHQFKDSEEFKEEVVIGRLGKTVGSKFLALLKTKIDVEEVLRKLAKDPTLYSSLRIEEKILVLNAIAQKSKEDIKGFTNLMKYMLENDKEMLMIMVLFMDKSKRIWFLKEFNEVREGLAKTLSPFYM